MAMANMNLIGVFVTKLWPVLALACGGGGGGDGGDGGDGGGGATKTIISPKFSNFGDIIITICQQFTILQNSEKVIYLLKACDRDVTAILAKWLEKIHYYYKF